MEEKRPRAKKAWHPNETHRVILLLANGYEKSEIAEYLGRPKSSITSLLNGLETTQEALQNRRGLTKREALLRTPLPPYDPTILYRKAEIDFPMLSLVPPLMPLAEAPLMVTGMAHSEQDPDVLFPDFLKARKTP